MIVFETPRVRARNSWVGRLKLDGLPVLAGFGATLMMWALDTELLSAVGVGMTVFSLAWYVSSLGKEISIVPIVTLVASTQLLLGPYFAYYNEAVTNKYFMYVPEEEYMSFVIPSIVSFVVGVRLVAPQISIARLQYLLSNHSVINSKYIYFALILTVLLDYIIRYIPSSLSFVAYLLSNAKYIMLIYLFIYRLKFRWAIAVLIFGYAVVTSANSGLFHEVILWSSLFLSFAFLELRTGTIGKFLMLLIGALIVVQLQLVKAEYRRVLLENPQSGGIGTLSTAMANSLWGDSGVAGEQNYDSLNARFNQGWIVSAIMAHVPDVVPHENGVTIVRALKDSLLPRFLSGKRAVDQSEAFRTYTGLPVGRNTTFGISPLGEAWVNFGYFGIVFMFVFGCFYGVMLRLLVYLTRYYPTIILWAPLLFLQAVKAETEIVIVLNHQVKTLILILIIYYTTRNILKIRI